MGLLTVHHCMHMSCEFSTLLHGLASFQPFVTYALESSCMLSFIQCDPCSGSSAEQMVLEYYCALLLCQYQLGRNCEYTGCQGVCLNLTPKYAWRMTSKEPMSRYADTHCISECESSDCRPVVVADPDVNFSKKAACNSVACKYGMIPVGFVITRLCLAMV